MTRYVMRFVWADTGVLYGLRTTNADTVEAARREGDALVTAGNAKMASRGLRKGATVGGYRLDTVRPEYRAGHARIGEATPQSDPELFTDAEIMKEIRYLIRLNEKYGTHELRVSEYTKLTAFLRERQAR